MVYLLPLFSFVVPLIAAHVAMRARRGWIAALIAALAAIGFAWAVWKGRQFSGWDGIGYAIFAVLMMAPAILGTGTGALIAWWRFRRGQAGG